MDYGKLLKPKKTPPGELITYDNPRENIDPHVRTKVLDAKEIVLDGTRRTTWPGGAIPTSEYKLGNDCSGTDGGTNRILTLTNTTLSSEETIIVDKMVYEKTQDYTVNHQATGTTVTFLGEIWNTQRIVARYFI